MQMYVRGTQRVQCRQSTSRSKALWLTYSVREWRRRRHKDKTESENASVGLMKCVMIAPAEPAIVLVEVDHAWLLILNSRDYAQSGLGSHADHPTTLMLHVHADENTYIHSCLINTTHITVIHHYQWIHTVWTFVYLAVLGCLTLYGPSQHCIKGTETNLPSLTTS